MNKLENFIAQARNKGYDDFQIKNLLIQYHWPIIKIEKAFSNLNPKYKFKNKITIFLDKDILKKLDSRAKKNMFTISEQIEDILRRSCLNAKRTSKPEKLDDLFVSLFSRKN